MFDNITENSLLWDFYGELLTDNQKQIFELYHDEDYSLADIASELGKSRQAVHLALKSGEKSLQKYEERLGLVKKFEDTLKTVDEIELELDRVISNYEDDPSLALELKKIKSIIEKLED
ncbi:MAG: DNA-binding protein [Clostridia bacterium]|nr:DNA-binding protein [Clostridia bacterium]